LGPWKIGKQASVHRESLKAGRPLLVRGCCESVTSEEGVGGGGTPIVVRRCIETPNLVEIGSSKREHKPLNMEVLVRNSTLRFSMSQISSKYSVLKSMMKNSSGLLSLVLVTAVHLLQK
jgi:hypothetical protein